MRPCFAVEIETPKKYVLNGLWFGPKRPKRVTIFIHGLGGSVFSMSNVVNALADAKTAVIAFNNRGFGKVNTVKRKVGTDTKSLLAGAAHEVFTDCADDIQGAINFVRRAGAKEVYLAGHSTGCQKAILWASRKGRGVRGIVLLAPVSDWAGETMLQGKKKIARAIALARALVGKGQRHELLPKGIVAEYHKTFDAQRLLSLYSPGSIEEIFSYGQPRKNPTTLKSVKVPVLVLWAGKDEYADRPAKEIAAWFESNISSKHKVVIVPNVKHSLKGGEGIVAGAIKKFVKELG